VSKKPVVIEAKMATIIVKTRGVVLKLIHLCRQCSSDFIDQDSCDVDATHSAPSIVLFNSTREQFAEGSWKQHACHTACGNLIDDAAGSLNSLKVSCVSVSKSRSTFVNQLPLIFSTQYLNFKWNRETGYKVNRVRRKLANMVTIGLSATNPTAHWFVPEVRMTGSPIYDTQPNSYLTGNILRLRYKAQPVNAV
jgi:hypothetical protein